MRRLILAVNSLRSLTLRFISGNLLVSIFSVQCFISSQLPTLATCSMQSAKICQPIEWLGLADCHWITRLTQKFVQSSWENGSKNTLWTMVSNNSITDFYGINGINEQSFFGCPGRFKQLGVVSVILHLREGLLCFLWFLWRKSIWFKNIL